MFNFKKFNKLSTFFNRKCKLNFKIDSFIFKRLESFSKPGFERGALKIVMSVLKGLKNLKVKYDDITLQSVKEHDFTELNIYCKSKFVSKNVSNTNFVKTINFIHKLLFLDSYEFKLIEDNFDCLDKLPIGTSSCYPNYQKKGDIKERNYSNSWMNNFCSTFYLDSKFKYLNEFPTTIFHRFSPKFTNDGVYLYVKRKIRQIFGVPAFICALEVKFFNSFKENFLIKLKDYHTVGLSRLDISFKIGVLRECAKQSGKVILCGDIKGCDKSIPAMFHEMFYTLSLEGVKDENVIKCILALSKYMTFTPILSLAGKVKVSHGSTTTGSWLTTIFTTFTIFFCLQYFYLTKYGNFAKVGEILLQGDDFLIVLDRKEDFNDLKQILGLFNLRLKNSIDLVRNTTEELEFLGFSWNQQNSPGASEEWIATRILFPEKYYKLSGPDRIISRYLSIIILLRNFKYLFGLFLDNDPYLKRRWRSRDFNFKLFDLRGNVQENNVPISKFLELGWRIT